MPKLEVIEDEDEGGEKYETEPFQIVCAPHEGKYWGTDIFQEWFADKEEDYGPWFDDASLLRSLFDDQNIRKCEGVSASKNQSALIN